MRQNIELVQSQFKGAEDAEVAAARAPGRIYFRGSLDHSCFS